MGHHGRHVLDCASSTKDRRQTQDWECKLPPGADQEGVSHAPDARVNREGNQQPHIGDQGALGNGQGQQGNFETLHTVEAPKSSIGEDKDKPSPGSNAGAKPAIVGNQDNPDVRNATDHIAKWTNLGPDIEMQDANKGLKTIKPKQPCISPRKLKLKQSSMRQGSD
ncbi:hypothetical protein RHS04_06752 [Rhizoctonia solani]|uniref:Uncharacterized protein n=1 Tax=Rhizoctonia solani TaxID=456999 RepID=A0A8H7H500_9AGAM|nr:hypothetical protein RHS04_06752 [Rhizoctonia solani]